MYLCTICGLLKSELSGKPEFEFRRRRYPNQETVLEGMSDWCTKCEALRFFFKSDNEQEPRLQPAEQTELQSKRRPEASTKSWNSKANKDRITRRDAHKLMIQEITAGLPSQLPRGSFWERKMRSISEDRDRCQQKSNPAKNRRSCSVVNELPKEQAKQAKQSQRRQRNPRAKEVSQLAVKNLKLDYLAPNKLGLHDEEDGHSSSSSTPTPPPRFTLKIPFDKQKLEALVRPWEDKLQCTQQFTNESSDKKRKTKDKQVISNKNRLAKDEMLIKVQELQAAQPKRQLKTQLKEKKQQMLEWKRIRRHVDHEYERVKTELNELKFQADLKTERQRRDKLDEEQRMRGGAQITAIKPNDQEQCGIPLEKSIGDALDEKMERMLEALEEKASQVEQQKTIPKELVPVETVETTKKPSPRAQRVLSKLNILVSTVQRARFRGFAEDPQELLKRLDQKELQHLREPPLPQFQTLPCARDDLVNLLHIKRELLQPNRIRPLKVCRTPIYCPDCDCRRMFFISDFNDHLTHDHPSLAMERISPCQAKTFFLDTQATQLNKAKCNMVYFVKNKFLDHNSNSHPELLPILVMSARLRLTEIFNPNYDPSAQLRQYNYMAADNEIFLIWLTSVCPDDTKIIGTISVWPTSSNPKIECLLVHTNEVYNIRSSQKLRNMYSSNRIVALSGNFVSRLTAGGKNLLAVQVQIH